MQDSDLKEKELHRKLMKQTLKTLLEFKEP